MDSSGHAFLEPLFDVKNQYQHDFPGVAVTTAFLKGHGKTLGQFDMFIHFAASMFSF